MNAYAYLAPFYDRFTADVSYEAFADFYAQVFKQRELHPKTILDLACGTGSLTCILAKRGYEMIGADASAEMLSIADEKAADLSPKPLFLNQAMEELDLYGTVDACICALDAVNYVPREALQTAFQKVWLFLEPGGVFIFDINSQEKLEALDGQVFVDENEDALCLWRTEFSPEDRTCFYGVDLFVREGSLWRREREEHIEYAYSPDELRSLLFEAGFRHINCYGGPHMCAPEPGDPRIFFVASKAKQGIPAQI